MISLEYLIDADHAAWDAYVQAHRDATIYHLSAWQTLIERTFGHESHYVVAKDAAGNISGVLPLIRLNSRLFGDYMVSMPFFNYGGPVGDSREIEEELMRYAGKMASEMGVAHVEFRDSVSRAESWPVKTDKVSMHLGLPDSVDELWKGLSSKVRAQVRRPQRENVSTRVGGIELLPEFYEIFARNMRDLGTPVYGRKFFAAILQTFPEHACIAMASMNGKPVAAGFLLGYGERMEIPWASSLREHNRIGVNMAMYWQALQTAVERGHKVFDFGRSSVDSGTFRFKKQWGAKAFPLYWHYWLESGGELPQLNPNNPKYRLAIDVWKKLPVCVTRIVGPMLVKNLP